MDAAIDWTCEPQWCDKELSPKARTASDGQHTTKRRCPRRRKPSERRPPSLPEPGPDAPYWLPRGESWKQLPPLVQSAVQQVLLPLWNQLLRESAGPLDRSIAVSFVHLVWLELCDHINIGEVVGNRDSLWSRIADIDGMIHKHLGLLEAKNRTSQLLAKVRFAETVRAQQQDSAATPRIPATVNAAAWARWIPHTPQIASNPSPPCVESLPVQDPSKQ